MFMHRPVAILIYACISVAPNAFLSMNNFQENKSEFSVQIFDVDWMKIRSEFIEEDILLQLNFHQEKF